MASDPLGTIDDPQHGSPVCCWALPVPHCDAICEDALHSDSVEGHQQFLLQVVPSEHSQEVESLLGLLQHCCEMSRQGEVVSDGCQ